MGVCRTFVYRRLLAFGLNRGNKAKGAGWMPAPDGDAPGLMLRGLGCGQPLEAGVFGGVGVGLGPGLLYLGQVVLGLGLAALA